MRLTDALFNRGPFKAAETFHPQSERVPFKVRLRFWFYEEVVFPMIMFAKRPGNLRWRIGWWLNERFCITSTEPREAR